MFRWLWVVMVTIGCGGCDWCLGGWMYWVWVIMVVIRVWVDRYAKFGL